MSPEGWIPLKTRGFTSASIGPGGSAAPPPDPPLGSGHRGRSRRSGRPELVAPVDAKNLAGDVTARVGHEVLDGPGDVLGSAVSLEGLPPLEDGVLGLAGGPEAGGERAARRDAIHGDVV